MERIEPCLEASLPCETHYVLLIGPPGSGKGTQSAQLCATLRLPHLASGDLLREHVQRGTVLGRKARSHMDRGDLVPDDVVIDMVMDRLGSGDCVSGALFDGFPRTLAQAAALDRALATSGRRVGLVLYIEVPDAVLAERLGGRFLCRACGASYHVVFHPPRRPGLCDCDDGELYQRDDDRPDTLARRLNVYRELTVPLIDYYRRHGVLVTIDGNQPIATVTTQLYAELSRVFSNRTEQRVARR